jgi:hypothetical protein
MEDRPSPQRFVSALLSSLGGIALGVAAFVATGVMLGLEAVEAGAYQPGMSPGVRLFFIPLLVVLIALIALPIDLLFARLARPRVLSKSWQSLVLGAAYSLVALPLAFSPSEGSLAGALGGGDGVILALVWLLLPLLAALAIRFGLGQKSSGAGV